MRDDSRASAARHAVGRTRSVWAGAFRAVAVTLAVVVASGGSVAAYGVWQINQKVGDRAVDIGGGEVPGVAAIDGAFNVLLVGADNAPGQKGFGEARETALNDVNILVHVSADHRSGTVVSLPRDLVMPHPECSDPDTGEVFSAMSAQALNTAYTRGGLGCVVGTVESLTGLNIPYAALFSFEGTVAMADAVGGVPVCVSKRVNDPESGLKLKKGRSVISGRTALAYLRSRHGVGDGSDLSRIASQQAYMSSLLRTMTSSSTLTDPAKLYALGTATADNVTLSESLASVDTIMQMAVALKDVDLDRMVFVQYPVGADPYDENKVVPNLELATRLLDRVQRDKRIVLDDDALGLATRVSKKQAKALKAAEQAERRAGSSSGGSPSSTASPTPSPTEGDGTKPSKALLSGLRGQTAAQQTCSIAA